MAILTEEQLTNAETSADQPEMQAEMKETVSDGQILSIFLENNIVDFRRFLAKSMEVEVDRLPDGVEKRRLRAWVRERGNQMAMVFGEQIRQALARDLTSYTPPAKKTRGSISDMLDSLVESVMSGSFTQRENCDGNCSDCPVNAIFGGNDDEKKEAEQD